VSFSSGNHHGNHKTIRDREMTRKQQEIPKKEKRRKVKENRGRRIQKVKIRDD
jgi:hypothetical protein